MVQATSKRTQDKELPLAPFFYLEIIAEVKTASLEVKRTAAEINIAPLELTLAFFAF